MTEKEGVREEEEGVREEKSPSHAEKGLYPIPGGKNFEAFPLGFKTSYFFLIYLFFIEGYCFMEFCCFLSNLNMNQP